MLTFWFGVSLTLNVLLCIFVVFLIKKIEKDKEIKEIVVDKEAYNSFFKKG